MLELFFDNTETLKFCGQQLLPLECWWQFLVGLDFWVQSSLTGNALLSVNYVLAVLVKTRFGP